MGIALMKTPIASLPAVYLLINKGNIICKGVIGIANKAKRSFGTPDSTNFNPVTLSAAAKPI